MRVLACLCSLVLSRSLIVAPAAPRWSGIPCCFPCACPCLSFARLCCASVRSQVPELLCCYFFATLILLFIFLFLYFLKLLILICECCYVSARLRSTRVSVLVFLFLACLCCYCGVYFPPLWLLAPNVNCVHCLQTALAARTRLLARVPCTYLCFVAIAAGRKNISASLCAFNETTAKRSSAGS